MAPFVLKSDGKADDGADDFHHSQGLAGDNVVEKLVGDISAVALTGEKPAKFLRVFDVGRPLVPFQFVKPGHGRTAGLLGLGLSNAADEMVLDGLVDGFADHIAADAGGFKVAPRHGVLFGLQRQCRAAPSRVLENRDAQRIWPRTACGHAPVQAVPYADTSRQDARVAGLIPIFSDLHQSRL